MSRLPGWPQPFRLGLQPGSPRRKDSGSVPSGKWDFWIVPQGTYLLSRYPSGALPGSSPQGGLLGAPARGAGAGPATTTRWPPQQGKTLCGAGAPPQVSLFLQHLKSYFPPNLPLSWSLVSPVSLQSHKSLSTLVSNLGLFPLFFPSLLTGLPSYSFPLLVPSFPLSQYPYGPFPVSALSLVLHLSCPCFLVFPLREKTRGIPFQSHFPPCLFT